MCLYLIYISYTQLHYKSIAYRYIYIRTSFKCGQAPGADDGDVADCDVDDDIDRHTAVEIWTLEPHCR